MKVFLLLLIKLTSENISSFNIILQIYKQKATVWMDVCATDLSVFPHYTKWLLTHCVTSFTHAPESCRIALNIQILEVGLIKSHENAL